MSTFEPLSAAQLRNFDPEARALIVRMCEAGWTGRVSNRGHATMHAPDGVTTLGVSPNYHRARAGRNAEANFRRWERRQEQSSATLSSATNLNRGAS